jgi:hypothetical protein
MNEAQTLVATLRQSADPEVVCAIESVVRDAPDNRLNRINALAFAAKTGLNEDRVIAALLHAARLGMFEMSWNVLCPGCGGVLDAGASLKTVNQTEYGCALCGTGYEPTLDEMLEVTFTVTPRIRRIAAHAPNDLPALQFYRHSRRPMPRGHAQRSSGLLRSERKHRLPRAVPRRVALDPCDRVDRGHPQAFELLEADGIKPTARRLPVRGVADEMAVYEIP